MGIKGIAIVTGVVLLWLVLIGTLRWLVHRHERDVPRHLPPTGGDGQSPLDI